jgi:hypothetical protein
MTDLQNLRDSLKVNLTASYVTGGDSKSLALRLQKAEFLMLVSTPRDAAAEALVERLAANVGAQEQRRRPRGQKERKYLAEAVAAVVGGVLKPALRRSNAVFRSRSEDAYGGDVGYSAALAALDGLTALGYLRHHPGLRYEHHDGFSATVDWTGLASRYEATETLVGLSASYGITAETVKGAFTTRFPAKAEVIKTPIELKQFKMGRSKTSGGQSIRVSRSDDTYRQLTAEVRRANRLLAAPSWSNCRPPSLRRTFRGDWNFGGRWVVPGDSPVQMMSGEERLDILIDGQPVCELDARGSQLSIVAALDGMAELSGDPYQLGPLAAFDREVVKMAATVTLGSGKLRRTWPKGMEEDATASMAEVSSALVLAHPYLRRLSELLRVPSDRVSLRLQNIEAQCLTHAMRTLWAEGLPVVPIHDGLLVPATAAEIAEAALREGYRAVAGAIIQTKRIEGANPRLPDGTA